MNKTTEALKLAEALENDAKEHREVSYGLDCPPECTANWKHALNCEAAARLIREALAEQSKCACDSPAWCTKYKKCNREVLGLPKAQPVKQEPVADESPRFETEDHDLTTLLELTVDIYSGICNHDTAVWWHETLGKVEAKLTPVERQWVDLTDEEIYKCRSDYGEYETCRSVIAKFKEKNK